MKMKWALVEVVSGGKQNLLMLGSRKEVRARLKSEKGRHKNPKTPPQRILLLMRLWKQWPKKAKVLAQAA